MTVQVSSLAQTAQDFSAQNVSDIMVKFAVVGLVLYSDPSESFGSGVPSPGWEDWVTEVINLSTPDFNDLEEETARLGHVKPSRLVRGT